MSNQNTVAGVFNLPKQVITVTTEVALLVPAAAGTYPGLPSPVLAASSGLSIAPSPDITGAGSALDLHRFRINLFGKLANPGAGNVTVKLYQVPATGVGVISATGSVTTAGAPGSGDVVFDALTAFTTPANPTDFFVSWDILWDSAANWLHGMHQGLQNASGSSTVIALAAVSSAGITSGVATAAQLNFLPSFTFATGNAANGVTVSEYVIERV